MLNISFDIEFDFHNQSQADCLLLAGQLIKNQEQKKAIALLEIALKFYHKKIRIYYLLGKAYKNLNKDKAIEYLEKSLELRANFREGLVEICQYKPEYYKQLINLAHHLRNKNLIGRSDAVYNQAFQIQRKHNIINRTCILQNYIDKKDVQTYLEIGVFVGHNLLQMKAPNTIVVDPFIQVPHWRDNKNPNINYYELTSDDFFEKEQKLLQKQKIQACLIDGLHTYEQSLKDVLNTLDNGTEDCLIIMHDCKPANKAAAQPTMALGRQTPGYNGLWMGDVYKTIIWLRSFRPDVQAFVLDCDCGLGIVKKGKPESSLNLSEADIENMTYDDLIKDMKNLINLKPAEYYYESKVFE